MMLSFAATQYPPNQQQQNRQNTVYAQLEFHTALAERLYNLMATIVNANVNIVLWLKKSLISFFIRMISYASYFIANNQEFVSAKIDFFSNLLKTFVAGVPYFNVPSVARASPASAPSEYAIPQQVEPSWLYEMPNHSFLNPGSNNNNNDEE